MAAESTALHIEQVSGDQPRASAFRLAGDLDLSSVDLLRGEVGPACLAGHDVFLDLSELKFCDSTGVGALVWLHRRATAAQGRLLLVAPRRHVREVLRISGVDRVIPVLGRAALAKPPLAPTDGATGTPASEGAPT